MGYADSSRTGTHGGQLEWSTKDRFSQHDFNMTFFVKAPTTTTLAFRWLLETSVEDYRNNIPNYMRTLQHHGIIETVWPICSMYGIFTNICPKNHPNVGKYTIHGAFGWGSLIHPWPCCSHHKKTPGTCGISGFFFRTLAYLRCHHMQWPQPWEGPPQIGTLW
jgi:hypothetical protein